jgi:hypothetical protein
VDDKNFSVPYIVFEGAEAKSERTIKRLIIALVITIALLFATNLVWLIEFFSYDYADEGTTTTVEADDSSTANYIGQDGDITYGGENNGQDTQEVTDTE